MSVRSESFAPTRGCLPDLFWLPNLSERMSGQGPAHSLNPDSGQKFRFARTDSPKTSAAYLFATLSIPSGGIHRGGIALKDGRTMPWHLLKSKLGRQHSP